MDDLQDLEDDIRSGQENAVFHLLEADERRNWLELRVRLGSAGEAAAWARFWSMLDRGRVAERTLERIAALLEAAEATARRAGWPSLARELAAARRFQT